MPHLILGSLGRPGDDYLAPGHGPDDARRGSPGVGLSRGMLWCTHAKLLELVAHHCCYIIPVPSLGKAQATANQPS